MNSEEALAWLVAVVAGLWGAGYALGALARARKRRARQLRYLRAAHETGPQQLSSRPAPLGSSIPPQLAARIRQQAEMAALNAPGGRPDPAANPYLEGSSEYLLWLATYHLTLIELDEQAELRDDGTRAPKDLPRKDAP